MIKLERRIQKDLYEEWDSPGKRRRQQPLTDKNSARVLPSAFTWTRGESTFKVTIKKNYK